MSKFSRFLEILARVAPLTLSLIPGIPAAIAPFVAMGIAQAEHLPGASGPAKLQAAISITRQGFAGLNAAAGHEVIDPDLSDAALAHGISAVVDIANIMAKKTAAGTAPPTTIDQATPPAAIPPAG
jgi:hypothetical protein